MVSLDARPGIPNARSSGRNARSGRDGTKTEWLLVTGAAAAALGAAVGMAVLSAVTVLLWASGPIATDGVSAAPFRGAAALWLMGQRAPLDAGTYDLVLAAPADHRRRRGAHRAAGRLGRPGHLGL